MRIKGKSPDRPKPELVVIPRQGGEDIVFLARLVNYDRFDAICKRPEPPVANGKDGVKFEVIEDSDYKKAIQAYGTQRFNYMIIESLSETEGLTWDTVNADSPDTWGNYDQELREAGFTQHEINHVLQAVIDANSMNEDRFKEARERFLRTRAAELQLV